jgi:hypothetical protein
MMDRMIVQAKKTTLSKKTRSVGFMNAMFTKEAGSQSFPVI